MEATIVVKEKDVNKVHTVAKNSTASTVYLTNVDTEEVEKLLKKAGSKIASVHFLKRSNKELRKMCYRLGVRNPSFASKPKGGDKNRKEVNKKNNQLTVFDVNKVCRDRKGKIKYSDDGKQLRGAWRTVPLENVTRVCVDGVTYQIKS